MLRKTNWILFILNDFIHS